MSAVRLAQQRSWAILFSAHTPYASAIQHACTRWGVPHIKLFVQGVPLRTRPRRSFDSRPSEPDSKLGTIPNQGTLIVEPRADACIQGLHELGTSQTKPPSHDASTETDSDIPIHDRLTVILPPSVFVAWLNDSGKIARLIERRLSEPDIPEASVYMANRSTTKQPRPSNKRARNKIDWLAKGVVGWIVGGTDHSGAKLAGESSIQLPGFGCRSHSLRSTQVPLAPIRMLGEPASVRRLVHCTRARQGAWPDQSLEQFHDELMQHPWSSAPTPFQSLVRILQQQRLIATDHWKRGTQSSVCFSERHLMGLLQGRHFQSHLGRWDWEPYGIAIDIDWMSQHGAEPVRYVDADRKSEIPQADEWLSQSVGNGPNDWRREREWRFPGDVRLSGIPFHQAIVFVRDCVEASALRHWSRWPIYVLQCTCPVRGSPASCRNGIFASDL